MLDNVLIYLLVRTYLSLSLYSFVCCRCRAGLICFTSPCLSLFWLVEPGQIQIDIRSSSYEVFICVLWQCLVRGIMIQQHCVRSLIFILLHFLSPDDRRASRLILPSPWLGTNLDSRVAFFKVFTEKSKAAQWQHRSALTQIKKIYEGEMSDT